MQSIEYPSMKRVGEPVPLDDQQATAQVECQTEK